MRVIRRYANRKLYDTEEKQYVSLAQVAELVRAGEEIQVLDHRSGEDLTSATLSRLLQRREENSLPQSLLRTLIRLSHLAWDGLKFDEERLEFLVSRGEVAWEEAQGAMQDEALRGQQRLEEAIQVRVERALERSVASKADLEGLEAQVDELWAKVDALLGGQ